MGIGSVLSSIGSAGLNIVGGNVGSGIQRRGIRKASQIADQGYNTARGYEQPVYDQALGNSQTLSRRNAAGDFSQPTQTPYQAQPFSYDPSQVQNDPEYKAQMTAGTNAIQNSAAAQGGLFSGKTSQDLTKYASDLYASRSDDLYNRARGAYTSDRDFGANAAATAFNQNNQLRGQDFQRGLALSANLPGATSAMTGLATGRADNLANAELGVANVRAGNYGNAYGQAGQGLESLLANGSDTTGGLQGLLSKIDPKTLMALLSGGAGAY